MLEASDFDQVTISKIEDFAGNKKGWRCTIRKNFSFMNYMTVTVTDGTRKGALSKARELVKNTEELYWQL